MQRRYQREWDHLMENIQVRIKGRTSESFEIEVENTLYSLAVANRSLLPITKTSRMTTQEELFPLLLGKISGKRMGSFHSQNCIQTPDTLFIKVTQCKIT